MIDDLLQRWYATGAVEDGHRYIAALQREGWQRAPAPEQLLTEIAQLRSDALQAIPLDDGATTGVALTAWQQSLGGQPGASLLVAHLGEVRYLVLPQRWARSPVRMLRVRVTTCPDAGQIGAAAHAAWLERVRAAYGLGGDAAPSLLPTSSAALELDLGEVMVAHWRARLRDGTADARWLTRLLALLDLVISFRGERAGSIDTAAVAFDDSVLPDRVLDAIDPSALGGPPGLRRTGDSAWQAVAWSFAHALDEGDEEHAARLALHIDDTRWWFEKRVLTAP